MPPPSDITREKIAFGPFEANLATGELRKFGIRIKLQSQPFRVLIALIEHPGEIVTREELQRRIWGEGVNVDFDRSLGTAVNKVREALSDSADNPRYIETLARRGYRFIAPVQIIGPPVSLPPPAEDIPTKLSTVVEVLPAEAPTLTERKPWPIVFAFAFVGVCGVLLLAFALARSLHKDATPGPAVRFFAITRSDRVYSGETNFERFPGMVTDGVRVYFSEMRDGRLVLASSALSGGQTQTIPTPSEIARPIVADVSRDGSTLLVRSLLSSTLEEPLWTVPSTGGAAIRVQCEPAHDAAWLPNSRGIVYAAGHSLFITRNDGSPSRKWADLPGRAFWLRFSPDGERMRFTIMDSTTHTSSLWEISANGSHLHRLLAGWTNSYAECCGNWTAAGDFIFQSTRNSMSNIWTLPDKTGILQGAALPVQLTAGPLSYLAPVPVRDGKRILVIGSHGRVDLLRLNVAPRQIKPFLTELNAHQVAFSRDGQLVAWSSASDNSLWRSRIDGSERIQLTSPPLSVYRIAWSPDGHYIAFNGREFGKGVKIYVISATGGSPEPLLHEDRNESDPSWSADGNFILFGRVAQYMGEDAEEKTLRMIDRRSGAVTAVAGSSGLRSPRWSPDGRYIAAIPLDDSKLMILDRNTGRWSRIDGGRGIRDPIWTGDSKTIYFSALPAGSVYRVSPQNGQLTRIAGLEDVEPADTLSLVGVTPDNAPLLFATVLTADIYAVDRDR